MRQWIDLLEDSELPMDKASRMKRAKELGYIIPAYHGTTAKFNEFDFERGRSSPIGGFAPYFTDRHEEAKGYADTRGEERGEKGRVMHVLLRIRKPLYVQNLFAKTPDEYERIDPELYKTITGGALPDEDSRQRYLTVMDAFRHAGSLYYQKTQTYDHRAIWAGIYQRLRKAGYDAIIHTETPADHSPGSYSKIVMLDMSGIRLTTAAFDPAKSNSSNLRA